MPLLPAPSPAGRSAPRLSLLSLLLIAVVLAVGACGGGGDGGTAADGTITVASFDFSESRTLAELYAQALDASGFPVQRTAGAGSRELVGPALEQGAADLVPEYLGSALHFLNKGMGQTPSDTPTAHKLLTEAFASRGLVPLQPAPAEDKNVVVVTRAKADELGLSKVSDLIPVAGNLVFGGPPECPERPLCLIGLRATYGLAFKSFRGLDVGGTETVDALQSGEVDVGLLFTTSPALITENIVPLVDDRHLQPAENVVPVVRADVLERHGPRLAAVLDAVSAKLDTASLIQLNKRIDIDGAEPADVVRKWLNQHPDLAR